MCTTISSRIAFISKCLSVTGEVGNASKMNLVIQMIAGITLAGLAEGLALADRCGLQQSDILEVISMTSLKCPMISEKGKCKFQH